MTEVSFVFLDIVTLNSVCNECLRALNSRLCSRAFHDLLAGSLTDAGHATLAFEFFIRVTPVVAFQGISGQEYTKSLQAERSYTKGAGRSRWKKEKPIWSLMPSGRY